MIEPIYSYMLLCMHIITYKDLNRISFASPNPKMYLSDGFVFHSVSSHLTICVNNVMEGLIVPLG